jgi:hypothetical protein
MKATTQKQEVKNHLEKFGHLSSIIAIKEYGITRLADVIFRLRNDGLNISTLTDDHTNRYGNKGTHAVYQLNK